MSDEKDGKKTAFSKLSLDSINLDRRVIKKHYDKIEGATVRHAHKFVIKRLGNVREVQRQVTIWVLVMAGLIAATGLQLMWNQQSYQKMGPVDSGTYAEAVLGPIDTINPIFAATSAEQSVNYLVFSRLANYDKTGHLNYDLATNISTNDAKTIYTVNIRPDVKWHDGVKLTAADIVFTVNLIKDPSTRSVITGWEGISVKEINDTTVEFTLQQTYAAFEHALTFPILPQHILGKIEPANVRENSYSKTPVGSGPFKISFVQNVDLKSDKEIIHMARNEDYYRGTSKLARFQLHVFSNTDEILNALAKNEVNAATDLLPSDIGRIDSRRYDVIYKPVKSGVYAIINVKSMFLGDVNVRRALQIGTNTEAVRAKLPDETPALYLPFTSDQLTGGVPTAPQYNLANAQKLLNDSGWVLNSDGVRVKDGKLLKVSVVTMKNSELESVLEVLAGQWRLLGVSIETRVVDPNDLDQNVSQDILQARNFDVLLYQLNIGADPDVYAYWHSSQISRQGLNLSNYSNIISDDALSSARIRTETDLRNAKYITFARQWLSDVPAVGLYQSTMQYVRNKNINSFDNSNVFISVYDRYSDVLDWSVGSKSVYKTP